MGVVTCGVSLNPILLYAYYGYQTLNRLIFAVYDAAAGVPCGMQECLRFWTGVEGYGSVSASYGFAHGACSHYALVRRAWLRSAVGQEAPAVDLTEYVLRSREA